MADLKISQFADGGPVESTDEIAANRSGVNTKVNFGTAAALDAGSASGDVVTLEDVGGTPGLPAVDASQLVGITADQIGTGTVDNTEFSYLNGVTGAIQTQFNSKQAGHVNLTTLSSVTAAADKLFYFTSPTAGAVADLTAAGRALLDDASASAQRTTLGLGTVATQNTGTSGANVPLLNGANVHSGSNTFSQPILATAGISPNVSGGTVLLGYETGTWTPTLIGTSGTPTYTTQSGKYCTRGEIQDTQAVIITSSMGSLTGPIRIAGIPGAATPSGVAGRGSAIVGVYTGLVSGSKALYADFQEATNQYRLWYNGATGCTTLQASDCSASLNLYVGGPRFLF